MTTTYTTTARGLCAICGTAHALRRDGTLRSHWQPGTSHRCMGSGWAPEPSDPSATPSAIR